MTRELLNTLFVTTPGSYVRLESDNLRVEMEGELVTRVPLHHLGAVVLFSRVARKRAGQLRSWTAATGSWPAWLERPAATCCSVRPSMMPRPTLAEHRPSRA